MRKRVAQSPDAHRYNINHVSVMYSVYVFAPNRLETRARPRNEEREMLKMKVDADL